MAEGWRAILLRQPRWRAEAEVRAEYEAGARPDELIASLGEEEPGRVAIDVAVVDARPGRRHGDGFAAGPRGARWDRRSRSPARSARLPAYAMIARRYRRVA